MSALCAPAYYIASVTVSFASTAAILAIVAFGTFAVKLHRDPGAKFIQNKFDIESSSWLMILTSLSALVTSAAGIANYNCLGCTAAEYTCISNMGTYTTGLVSAVSATGAAAFKIASLVYQQRHLT